MPFPSIPERIELLGGEILERSTKKNVEGRGKGGA